MRCAADRRRRSTSRFSASARGTALSTQPRRTGPAPPRAIVGSWALLSGTVLSRAGRDRYRIRGGGGRFVLRNGEESPADVLVRRRPGDGLVTVMRARSGRTGGTCGPPG